jgi:hypothetical protein
MARITDEERKKRLLKAIPADGTAVGNKYLAKSLSWDLDGYLKLRNELVAEGKVEIGRGRGGSVRRVLTEVDPAAVAARRKSRRTSERSLYPGFLESLRLWAGAQAWTDYIIQQTSDQGRRRTGGRFTRPDFVVIGIKNYECTPGVVRDIETFEVKPLGATIEVVFEAASQSRVASKAYVALQTAENEPTEDELGRIESECQRFGIGLITFADPSDYQNWQYLAEPVRKEPDPELVEQFVRDQMSTKNQEHTRKWMRWVDALTKSAERTAAPLSRSVTGGNSRVHRAFPPLMSTAVAHL